MDNDRPITISEQRFCDRLIETESAVAAYDYAFGTLPNTTRYTNVDRVLQRRPVRDYLVKLRFNLIEQLKIDRETVLGELAAIGFANIADYVDHDGETLTIRALGELTRQQAACIKSITQDKEGRLKIEFHDKIAALDRIARIMGWTSETNVQAVQFVIQAPPLVEDEKEFEAAAQRQIAGAAETPESALAAARLTAAVNSLPEPPGKGVYLDREAIEAEAVLMGRRLPDVPPQAPAPAQEPIPGSGPVHSAGGSGRPPEDLQQLPDAKTLKLGR
jgi:phage terminase small subunit